MSNLLVLRTSVNEDKSFSNALLNEFIAKTKEKWPATKVVDRDLDKHQVPMLNSHTVGAIRAGVSDTEERRAAIALSDTLIAELKEADYIAIGLPRYNFTAPTTFKSFVDYIGRAGVTFKYSDKGPEGLLPDVPVYVFVTSGGEYEGTDYETMMPWVKQVLGFLGLKRVEVIYAEGLAYASDKALSKASAQIDAILSR